MPASEIGLLCLDFDGVVLESNSLRDAAWGAIFSDVSSLTRAAIIAFHRANPGIDRADKLCRIYKEIMHHVPSDEAIVRQLDEFSVQCENALMSAPMVGGIETLLQEVDVPVYVLTVAREAEVRNICSRRGLSIRLTGIRGGPISKSQHLRALIDEHAISPEQVLMVGDQVSDWHASQDVECRFVGRIAPDRPASFGPGVPIVQDMTLGWCSLKRLLQI